MSPATPESVAHWINAKLSWRVGESPNGSPSGPFNRAPAPAQEPSSPCHLVENRREESHEPVRVFGHGKVAQSGHRDEAAARDERGKRLPVLDCRRVVVLARHERDRNPARIDPRAHDVAVEFVAIETEIARI